MDQKPTTKAEEILALLDVSGQEADTIRRLDGCVAELLEVLAAKQALAGVTSIDPVTALDLRRRGGHGRQGT